MHLSLFTFFVIKMDVWMGFGNMQFELGGVHCSLNVDGVCLSPPPVSTQGIA